MAGKDSDNAIWLDYLARDFTYYGDALEQSGDVEAALDDYEKASGLRERALKKNPNNKSYQKNFAQIKKKIGELTARQEAEEKAAAEKAAAAKDKAAQDKAVQDKPAQDKATAQPP